MIRLHWPRAIIPIFDAVANAVNGVTKATNNFKIVAGEVKGTIDALGKQLLLVAKAFGVLGDAINYAASAALKLLLRADGMEQFNALGNNRYMAVRWQIWAPVTKNKRPPCSKLLKLHGSCSKSSNRTPRFRALTLQRLVVGQERTKLQKAAAQLKAAQDLLFVEQNRRMLLGEMTELSESTPRAGQAAGDRAAVF